MFPNLYTAKFHKRIGMVTVTGVEMSKDLKNAKIFVSVLGEKEETDKSISALNSAVHFVRGLLAERVQLKYIPAISFFYDSSTVDGMYMDRLFKEIKNKT